MHYDYLLSACVNNDVHIDIFEAGMMHSCEVCQEKILVTYHIGGLIICFQSSTGSPGFTQSFVFSKVRIKQN